MDIINKLSFILNDSLNEALKEENIEVEWMVKDLDRKALLKLEKVKYKYAYNQRNLTQERVSEYRNKTSFNEFDEKKLDGVFAHYKYKRLSGMSSQGNYDTIKYIKDKDNFVEILVDKKTQRIDSVLFNWKEEFSWK